MATAKNQERRAYELTYLVPTTYSETEVAKVKEDVSTLIKKYKGELTATEDWGKKPLAYTIKAGGKRHQEAHYVHVNFSLPSLKAQDFEQQLYHKVEIIRHLVVVASKAVSKNADSTKESDSEKAE